MALNKLAQVKNSEGLKVDGGSHRHRVKANGLQEMSPNRLQELLVENY